MTFNLYNNPNGTGTPLFTDANQPLSGGVATSTSYTTTATGTDYWVATYNGNGNNVSVSSGAAAEPVTVGPATPTISGTKFDDLTGNGFSADDTGLSGVTIDLYMESNGTFRASDGQGGDKLVATTITASNGAYSFSDLPAGDVLCARGRAVRVYPDGRWTKRQCGRHLLHRWCPERPDLYRQQLRRLSDAHLLSHQRQLSRQRLHDGERIWEATPPRAIPSPLRLRFR